MPEIKKFCPTCQTEYDEEILRFCTKDGTPLLDANSPDFSAMPSQSSMDDIGEETIISRKMPDAETTRLDSQEAAPPPQRIVIPTEPPVKAKPIAPLPPPKKSNTAKVVLFTLLGTLGILGGAAGAWWMMNGAGGPAPANINRPINSANNANTGINTNANTFGNIDFNINANTNINANFNLNINANLKTPSPTPKPSPKISPSPSPKPANANTNLNANAIPGNTGNINAKPANANIATPTPKPTPPPANSPPRNVSIGNVTSRATSLPKPAYPQIARQAGASGQVTVSVTIDENGNVVSAKAASGHPLLRAPAEAAARQARFSPRLGGEGNNAVGIVVYNFVN